MDSLNQQHQQAIINYGPSSAQVADLERKIKDKQNEMIAAILNEERPEGAASSYDQSLWKQIQQNKVQEVLNLDLLRNRERYYQHLISKLRAQNPQMLESAIESSRLQRQKEVSENLYLYLAEKGEEANIKSATGTGGVKDHRLSDHTPRPDSATHSQKYLFGRYGRLGPGHRFVAVN